jgi:hypothetical protein
MTVPCTFHAAKSGDFLGFRTAPSGATEIVYDDGATHRMIWRVQSAVREGDLGDALSRAVAQARVVPALFAELKKRSIAVEAVSR